MLTRRATVSRVSMLGSTANVCMPSAFTTFTRNGCSASDMMMIRGGVQKGPPCKTDDVLRDQDFFRVVLPAVIADLLQSWIEETRRMTWWMPSAHDTKDQGPVRGDHFHSVQTSQLHVKTERLNNHNHLRISPDSGGGPERGGPPPPCRHPCTHSCAPCQCPTMYNPIWEGQNWKQDGLYMYRSGRQGTHTRPQRLAPTIPRQSGGAPGVNAPRTTTQAQDMYTVQNCGPASFMRPGYPNKE